MFYEKCRYQFIREGYIDISIECKLCKYFADCPFIKDKKINATINYFNDFVEIKKYKEDIYIPKMINTNFDRTRKWKKNERGILYAKNENITLNDLFTSVEKSRRYGLDRLYGYALCNTWDYFITLTVDDAKSYTPEEIKNKWANFKKKIQRICPDIKIMLIHEKHHRGGIHFHGLIGNCDLSSYLVQGVDKMYYVYTYNYENGEKDYKLDKNGERVLNKHYGLPMTRKFNDIDLPVYNFIDGFYIYGFSTIVPVVKNSSKLQIINYLSKYMTKERCQLGYNEKSYFRTHNLNYKTKKSVMLYENELKEMFNVDLFKDIRVAKENDKMIIYRIFDYSKVG